MLSIKMVSSYPHAISEGRSRMLIIVFTCPPIAIYHDDSFLHNHNGTLYSNALRIHYGYERLALQGCVFSPISLLFMPVNWHNI